MNPPNVGKDLRFTAPPHYAADALMRIAVVNQPWSRFRPPVDRADSIAIWAYQVARRLPGAFHTIMLMRGNPGQPAAETQAGINYRRLPYWPKYRWYAPLERALEALGWQAPAFFHPAYHRFFASWAGVVAARARADVVHIHNFAQFVPLVRRQHPHARIVLHMHCEWLSQLPRAHVLPWVAQCQAIWACSDHLTRKIQTQFPELAARCLTVPNGTNLSSFTSARPPKPPSGEIVFVGRLSPEKGVHLLIEAFVKVADALPSARLRLVGPDAPTPREFLVDLDPSPQVHDLQRFYPGSYLAQLKAMIPERLRHRIEFVGELPPHRLPEIYARAQVVANPSLSESFGMSLVEAMAHEVPVVAAATGGMPEIVQDAVTGRVVPANDADALAAALKQILQNPSLAQAWTHAAKKRVHERYDWAVVAKQVQHAYQALERA